MIYVKKSILFLLVFCFFAGCASVKRKRNRVKPYNTFINDSLVKQYQKSYAYRMKVLDSWDSCYELHGFLFNTPTEVIKKENSHTSLLSRINNYSTINHKINGETVLIGRRKKKYKNILSYVVANHNGRYYKRNHKVVIYNYKKEKTGYYVDENYTWVSSGNKYQKKILKRKRTYYFWNSSRIYEFSYSSEPKYFLKYLPEIEKMIKSIRLVKC